MEKFPAERGKGGEPSRPAWTGPPPARTRWPRNDSLHATLGLSWSRAGLRILCLACSAGVLLYSVMVLTHVAWMGTIGVRCMFGTDVEEEVPDDFVWRNAEGRDERPQVGDELLAVGGIDLARGNYADYIRAMRSLSRQRGGNGGGPLAGSPLRASSRGPGEGGLSADALLRLVLPLVPPGAADLRHRRPGLLEAARGRLRPALLLALHRHRRRLHGGLPLDGDRASSRPRSIRSRSSRSLVPVVNLHFFLVFPSKNPVFLRSSAGWSSPLLYGIPAVFLAALWGEHVRVALAAAPRRRGPDDRWPCA